MADTMKLLKKKVFDGWTNLLTGMGVTGRDKTKSTYYVRDYLLSESEMISMYEQDGFAKRIIDLPVKEMTRKGFVVEGDSSGDVLDYYKKRKFNSAVRNMLRWSKVYGGAIGVMIIDDGNTDENSLEQPLNENNIKVFEGIKVYQRFRVDRTSGIDRDMNSDTYGELITFTVSPSRETKLGTQFKVHRSRVVLIDGIDLPDSEKRRNNNWGLSVLQSAYSQLRDLCSINGAVRNVMDSFETAVLTIENLQEMIAAGQEDFVKRRIELLDLSRHAINTMLLDAREKFEKRASSVAGIAQILQEFQKYLSAVTGIPMTLLMGQSPKGLSATGESDIQLWYDNIASEQEEKLLSVDERIISLILKSADYKGEKPEDWSIKYNSLWQMDEKEASEVRKNQAETDKIYIESGVLTADEVALSRFGGDRYSTETEINTELRTMEPEPEPDEGTEPPPTPTTGEGG